MRRLALAVAGVMLVSLAPAPVARADTPRCVTKTEFSRVDKGMLQRRVHRIFDTQGTRTALGPPEVRHYKPCTPLGLVQVSYRRNGRVASKSGYWMG